MGACLSGPEPPPAAAPGGRRSSESGRASGGPENDLARAGSRATVGSLTLSRAGSSGLAAAQAVKAALQLQLLGDISGLQQSLALINENPMLGLQEAAELLADYLHADLVAVWVPAKDDVARSVLMACHGKGTSVLQRQIVVRVPPGDAPCAGAPRPMMVADARAGGAGALPADLWQGPAGLRSFVQVPIGDPAAPRGVLLLAMAESTDFSDAKWQVKLHVASTGLLPHVRHAQVEAMAHLLKSMDDTHDPVALISVLLRSAARYLQRACSMRCSVRLALLQPGDGAKALLFEAPRGAGAGGSPRHLLCSPADAEADVVASSLGLHNTLLSSAISQQQARFVADVGMYMSNSVRPARDVFTSLSELVSSIVVVPLVADAAAPLGGLYFAVDAPSDFASSQDMLLGFIHGVTPMLHQRLAQQAASLQDMVTSAKRGGMRHSGSGDVRSSEGAATAGGVASGSGAVAGGGALVGEPSSSFDSSAEPQRKDADKSGALPSATATPSGRLASLSSNRVNTDAMLQVLQQDIRTKGRRCTMSAGPELTAGECLGRGGFGIVYKAWWHKVAVAAKVMPSRASEREAMQDAVEMAVLSSVQHPNIVSVYSCLTDMVEAGGTDMSLNMSVNRSFSAGASGPLSGSLRTRYRRLRPDEDPGADVSTYNIVVMEYCDRGTLRDAIKGNLFHAQLPGGAIGVDLGAVVEILLDVAYAVQYLHAMGLVHGDVKMENILLKSDYARALGVTPKLSDFGLTKILSDGEHAINIEGAGTVTHLAPEMFMAGSKVTTAVDAYAFGIMAWEVYTSKRAYAGLRREAVIERVFRAGLRPHFPASAPPDIVRLCEGCWQTDPKARPGFGEITETLERLAAELAPGAEEPSADGPPTPAAVAGAGASANGAVRP